MTKTSSLIRLVSASIAAVLLAWPMIAPARAAGDEDAGGFEDLRRQDMRVARVGFALAVSNAPACGPLVSAQSGLVLHSLGQYHPADRAEVARHFALGDAPGLMGVVAGSPAERAGLTADDALLSANGRSLLEAVPSGTRATNETVERATAILDEEMAKGPVTIRYRRGGAEAQTVLTPVAGCAAQVELLAGAKFNAWAKGRRIMVGEGLLTASATDDALAFVVAHELAHNIHGASSGPRHSREAEEAADRLGFSLMRAAGYDPGLAVANWSPYFHRAGNSFSHPSARKRIAALQSMLAAMN